jgi:hypothetical protein
MSLADTALAMIAASMTLAACGSSSSSSSAVTNASADPLNGTVDIAFVFAGQVVGRDTSAGSITLDWPIRVKK